MLRLATEIRQAATQSNSASWLRAVPASSCLSRRTMQFTERVESCDSRLAKADAALVFMIIRLSVYGARIADHLHRNPQHGNGPKPAASPGWPKAIGLPCSGADLQAVFEYILGLILAEITTT